MDNQARKGKPAPNTLYYGYSVNIGPDGRPRIREFGNVRPTSSGQLELGSREPFIETTVDERENVLKVVAEMPGVQKEDITTEVTKDYLTINAERGERKYNTTVSLNEEVDPNSARATYNNGILEVKLKLKNPPSSQQKPRGVNVKIE